MTKDNWIKAFDEQFSFIGGCIDRDTLANYLTIKKYGTEHLQDIKAFISQVEKDAKSESYTNGFRDGFDAGVEKTNKRWRKTEIELLAYLLDRHIDEGSYFGRKDQHYKMVKELKVKLSDLLEDKERA